MIRIFLVEDHQIVRQGIKNLLEEEKSFVVIGEAENGEDLIAQFNLHKPDLVITDLSLPQMDGITLIKKLLALDPFVKIIVLSMHMNEPYINDSFEAGSNGYLLKDCSKAELFSAITRVMNGERYCSRSISQILANNYLNKEISSASGSKQTVTKREKEILQLIAEGFNNREIAEKLFLSIKTVSVHRFNILQKMEAKNTAELISKSYKMNLIINKS